MSKYTISAVNPCARYHWHLNHPRIEKDATKQNLFIKLILHRPTVWFICTHMYIQRMDSGYSKYWPIFTSYQTLKIINKQHMLTLTIPAANSFSWILSIFDIGLKRAITNQYSILFPSKKLNYKMLNSAYTLCSYNKQRYSCFIVYDTSIWSILWYLVNFADILTFSESLG